MTAREILKELQKLSDPSTKRIHQNHGATEPFYGVKVQDLKPIQKKIKKDHELSQELYATGVSDAMYLAGLIADENKISKEQLKQWLQQARWYMLSEYTVAWLASESPYGMELGLEWIDSPDEKTAAAGWSTLASVASITPDSELDLATYEKLLERVTREMPASENRRRYTMNAFVIAVGCFVAPLHHKALEAAGSIGDVSFVIRGTACKVPLASGYIQKVAARGSVGKKKKMARC